MHTWKLFKKITLNSIKKMNIQTICHFLIYTVQFYSIHSQEFTGLTFDITFYLSALSFFVGSGSRTNNFGSGSREKFRIHANPDRQHCCWVKLRGVIAKEWWILDFPIFQKYSFCHHIYCMYDRCWKKHFRVKMLRAVFLVETLVLVVLTWGSASHS